MGVSNTPAPVSRDFVIRSLNLPLGLVTIKIVSASDLPACDSNGLCDPYAVGA
ncbi:hypothetical protein T484DRAFT_1778105 [Baffinella frigidus]|nr:hypothetical protein T484DRAFT_1778105 [Cryptophyta sp. CCMP2293]